MTRLRRLVVPRGPAVLGLLGHLEKALAGGDAIMPVAESGAFDRIAEEDTLEEVPEGVAVVIETSGSSGLPKRTMVTPDNLVASATATHEALGGAGRWLLAVPARHVAGMQVLVRSVVAGTTPEVLDLDGGFVPERFAEATKRLAPSSDRLYTGLVPTQLARLLDDPEGRRALRRFDAVLVGGAALSAADRERAALAEVRVVTTYGMSETAGGCVYDGRPLPVTQVHIDNDHHVVLGGATVAIGYLGQPGLTADAFAVDADGVRWFRTDDLGAFDDDGRLEIRGRADNLINTGGLKVAPGPVEDAITRFIPGVIDAVVVGTPHPTWGEAVSVAVTLRRGAPTPSLRDTRAALRGVVPDHALPERLLVLETMPQRGPGKPDRRALIAAFGERLSESGR
jgi:o-succinylbenzoate---CoA ligase